MVVGTHCRRLMISLAALLAIWSPASWCQEPRLAISGYDPVAYFTDGQPTAGRSEFEYIWHEARWRFASRAHREAFVADPGRYAPQYDGFCVMGVAYESGHKDTINPEAWAIVDGKLYLAHAPDRQAVEVFVRQDENLQRAATNWRTVKGEAAIYDGYPNLQRAKDE